MYIDYFRNYEINYFPVLENIFHSVILDGSPFKVLLNPTQEPKYSSADTQRFLI